MISYRSYSDSPYNLILSIISIILITTIISIILYINNKDNKEDNKDIKDNKDIIKTKYNSNSKSKNYIKQDNNFNIIEPFVISPTVDQLNTQILKLITEIQTDTNINKFITNLYNKSNDKIDLNIQTKISNNIKNTTKEIIDKHNSNNTYINNSIIKLDNQLKDLENIVNNLNVNNVNNKQYTTIKSLNNGLELTLIRTPNTHVIDPKTGSYINVYMLSLNNGCLSVGANDYDVYQCNDKNQKQFFKIEHILNEQDYENHIDKALPFDKIDKSTINYPFVMVKSINNQNYLTNKNGNLTVQPGYSFVAQRWLPM